MSTWRWALLALVCGCGSDPPARLVDMKVPALEQLCQANELSMPRQCPPQPDTTFCVYLYAPNSCAEIMLMLPKSCDATADDYIACAHASCSDYPDQCAAFDACGLEVYRGESASCY